MRLPLPAAVLAVVPALLVPAALPLARLAGGPALLPLLAVASVYPVMTYLVGTGRRGAAVAAVLLWAAALSATVITGTAADPAGTGALVLNGTAYREEMFDFIRSGTGRETDPRRFVPQHLLHLGLFALLAIVSGGLLGILLGAVLVDYMSFYVGSLRAACPASLLPIVAGWPPWAILRVVGFVLAGVVLAEPLLARLRGRSPRPAGGGRFARRALAAALVLLLLDIALKTWLAPRWAVLLRACLGPGTP